MNRSLLTSTFTHDHQLNEHGLCEHKSDEHDLEWISMRITKPAIPEYDDSLELYENQLEVDLVQSDVIMTSKKQKSKLTTKTHIDEQYEYEPKYGIYISFLKSNCLLLIMILYLIGTVSGICIGGYFTVIKANNMTHYTTRANCTVKSSLVTEKLCPQKVKRCVSTVSVHSCNETIEYYQCRALTDVEYVTEDYPCSIGTSFNITYSEIKYDIEAGQTVSCWTNNECDNIQMTASIETHTWTWVIIAVFYAIIISFFTSIGWNFHYRANNSNYWYEIEFGDWDIKGPDLSVCIAVCFIIATFVTGAFVLRPVDWIYFGSSLIFSVALVTCVGGLFAIQKNIWEPYTKDCIEFKSELIEFTYGREQFYRYKWRHLDIIQQFDYVLSLWVRKHCRNRYICCDIEYFIYKYYTDKGRENDKINYHGFHGIVDVSNFVNTLQEGTKIDALNRYDKWFKAVIYEYKPPNHSMPKEFKEKLSQKQVTNIEKLQTLPAVLVRYIEWTGKEDECIFIEMNKLCTCDTLCISWRKKHRLAKVDTQSKFTKNKTYFCTI